METTRKALEEKLVETMERMSAHRRSRSRSSAELSDLDLTMQQVRTLHLLAQEPRRMGDLAGYLDRGMSSVTSMIDRLVRKGFVERVEDPSDRRVVTCRLTDTGHDVVERFWRTGRVRAEEMATALTVEELRTVVPAMEIMLNAMSRRDIASADPSDETRDVGESTTAQLR